MDAQRPDAAADPAPPSDRPYDVLVAGVYFCDLIFTGLPQMPRLGHEIFGTGFDLLPGGTFNIVHALHRLGVRVGWHCEFGSDFVSQFVLDWARDAGLDDHFFQIHERPLRNLTVSLSFAEDRAFVTYADRFAPLTVPEAQEAAQARCVVLPVLYHRPDMVTLGEQMRDQGGLVFMDCAQNDATLDSPGVRAALDVVDVFTANEKEALQLTGASSTAAALDMLAPLTSLVVIKLGARGAVARQGTREVYVPALPGVSVVDTTGAGDCFNAGFLAGYLQDAPLARCLQIGNVVGGLSTRARGTQSAPTRAEVDQQLAAWEPDAMEQAAWDEAGVEAAET